MKSVVANQLSYGFMFTTSAGPNIINGAYKKTAEIKNGKQVYIKIGSGGAVVCWYHCFRARRSDKKNWEGWVLSPPPTESTLMGTLSGVIYAHTVNTLVPHPIATEELWCVAINDGEIRSGTLNWQKTVPSVQALSAADVVRAHPP
jgi:hypothetical protein